MRKEVESGSPLYHFYINIRNSRYPIKKMTETIVSRHLSLSPRHRQSLPLPFPQLTLRITRPLNTILICYSTEPKKSQHGNLQNHHKFWASYWIPDTCFHYFSPLTLGCSAFPQRSLLLQMQKKSVRVANHLSREEVPAGPVRVIAGRWLGVLGIVEFASLAWRLCNMWMGFGRPPAGDELSKTTRIVTGMSDMRFGRMAIKKDTAATRL